MKLQEIIDKHPRIRRATSKDNNDILDFFDDVDMKGTGINIGYERRPDFFKFLNFQSQDIIVMPVSYTHLTLPTTPYV